MYVNKILMKITFILSNITIKISLKFSCEIIVMKAIILTGRAFDMRFVHEGGTWYL